MPAAAPTDATRPASGRADPGGFEAMLGALRQDPGFLGGQRETGSQAAEMFNEDGLFAGVSPEPAQLAVTPPQSTHLQPSAEAQAELEAPRPPERGFGAENHFTRLANGDGSAEAAPPAHLLGQPRRSVSAQAAAPVVGRPVSPRSTQEPTAVSAPAKVRRAATVPQGPAAAVQLALQAGPDGIALVARALRLDREEELELRSAIDALLARHGLRAGIITINGESGPSAGFEGG